MDTAPQKKQMKGCDNEGYDNEGFLYINNRHFSQKKEDDAITFKKGMIRDSDGQIVCLGEFVPIVASHLDEFCDVYDRHSILVANHPRREDTRLLA